MGWALALSGAALLLLVACRGPNWRTLRDAALHGAASLAAASALALLPALACAVEVERARDAAESGLLRLSLDRLEVAGALLPVVWEAGDFLDQVGMLQSRLDISTPEASLHDAKALALRGRLQRADALFGLIARSEGVNRSVRREAARGLLRQGIRELDAGETTAGLAALETVLEMDPCNVKANYALQIANLRMGRYEAIDPLAARMRAVYRYFGTLTKVPVLAATQENVAHAAYLAGDPAGAQAAWKKLSDPKLLRTEP
jgi:hypothetical protein